MRIRTATSADIPAMIDLADASPGGAQWSKVQYEGLLGSRFISVVESAPLPAGELGSGGNARVLAFLVAHEVGSEWELENIVVGQGSRRIGIGYRLLNHLIDHAREEQGGAIFLEVRESNHAARSFYERSGWQESGQRKAYYSNPIEDAVLYRILLR